MIHDAPSGPTLIISMLLTLIWGHSSNLIYFSGGRVHDTMTSKIPLPLILIESSSPGVMATPLPLTTGLSSSSSSGGSMPAFSMLLTDLLRLRLPSALGVAPGNSCSATFSRSGLGSAGGLGVP